MKQQSKVHLYYLIILLLFVFSGYFIPTAWYNNTYFELFFSQVGLLMLPTAIFLLMNKPQFHQYLPLKRLSLMDMLFIPLTVLPLIFVGAFLNSLILFFVSTWHGPVYAPQYVIDTALPLLPYILGMAILPGIMEETIHRGILLATYRKQGMRFAMLTSALLFALLHLSIANFANTFMLGLYFAWLVYFTGSLLSSMYAHFFYNLFILLSEYFVTSVKQPEYLSLGLNELLSLIPFSLLATMIWILIFSQYKKSHPPVTLEPKRQALRSFSTLLQTDGFFAICFIFILSVQAFLLFL